MIGFEIYSILVLERVETPKNKNHKRGPYYRCFCKRCNNENYIATSGDLRSGRIKSCGCFRNSQEFADKHIVHGHRRQNKGTTTRTYNVWRELKRRCDNYMRPNYDYYGGRGITYDPTWKNYANFLADMGECPEGLEIDRIDNNGNYTKENCRWVTHKENCQNRRPRG